MSRIPSHDLGSHLYRDEYTRDLVFLPRTHRSKRSNRPLHVDRTFNLFAYPATDLGDEPSPPSSVNVLVGDERGILESMRTATMATNVAKKSSTKLSAASAAAAGAQQQTEKQGAVSDASLLRTPGELFDIIVLGGGARADAAEYVPVGEEAGDGSVEGAGNEGCAPAKRLDLLMDRCERVNGKGGSVCRQL